MRNPLTKPSLGSISAEQMMNISDEFHMNPMNQLWKKIGFEFDALI